MKDNLFHMVQSAKNSKEEAEQIIEIFKPKVKKTLFQTSFSNREDMNQELNLKLLEIIDVYDIGTVVGFWEFRNLIRRNN